jgi:hypothetical protein
VSSEIMQCHDRAFQNLDFVFDLFSMKIHFSDTSEHHNKFPDLLLISMNFVTNVNYS